jgi:Zn-dependent M16 (insulinase) family peptidase
MSFQKLREQYIPSLSVKIEEYEHSTSGARHIHLASESRENAFLVSFPTIPDTNDGRAHILEHLALYGSKKYPVRSPFFAMTQRSMSTFMNAMTYPDRTVYPFATMDRKDFFNLLDVYLDSTFFPNLDPLDFLQEGWRLTIDGDKLKYQGVVFNEMKGAFADPMRTLRHELVVELLRGTTYAVESGGDPLNIPDLSYDALVQFHRTHYHPSQALFMTYGDIPAAEIQQVIEDRVISSGSKPSVRMQPQLATPWPTPRTTQIYVPAQETREDSYGVQIGWLMGEMTNTRDRSHAKLLELALLGDSAAPLALAMESAGFGRPSAMNGLDDSTRQLTFHLGMEGLRRTEMSQTFSLLEDALKAVAKTGIPQSRLETVLRDFEMHNREITGGHTPYGLKLLLRLVPIDMNGGDILAELDRTPIIESLREEVRDPEFIKSLVKQLLSNATCLKAEVLPNASWTQDRENVETARLEQIRTVIHPSDLEKILADNAALAKRQANTPSTACLPRIVPADVDPFVQADLVATTTNEGAITTYTIDTPSNGVVYGKVHFDVTGLSNEDWPWLGLYCGVLSELGTGNRNYEDTQVWRSAAAPVFDVSLEATENAGHEDDMRVVVSFQVKGLARQVSTMTEVLVQSILEPKFDEHERLAYLIDSDWEDAQQSIAEDGGDYAKLLSVSHRSLASFFAHTLEGLPSLAFSRDIAAMLDTDEGMDEISTRLAHIHEMVLRCPCVVITAGAETDAQAFAEGVRAGLFSLPSAWPVAPQQAPDLDVTRPDLVLFAKAQVNECMATWAAPGMQHADAPALAVLARLCSHGYLHRSIREEGGAYGGYASYNTGSRAFSMASYRDPRLAETYADFTAAIEWVVSHSHSEVALQEAIIAVMQKLDRPQSPGGEALRSYARLSNGTTAEMRQTFRTGVLNCTIDDVKRVAGTWLHGKSPTRTLFAGTEAHVETAKNMGFEVIDLSIYMDDNDPAG